MENSSVDKEAIEAVIDYLDSGDENSEVSTANVDYGSEVEEEAQEEQEAEPIQSLPRLPSSVPLANGALPATAAQIAQEQNEREEYEEQMLKDAEREAYLQELQKQAQMSAANQAAEIVRQRVAEEKKAAQRSMTQQAKDARQAEKLIDNSGLFDEEHSENVRIMNDYRNKYKGRIPYNFRARYTIDLKPSVVKQEREECETMINRTDLPKILANAIKQIAGGLEGLSLLANFPAFNLAGLQAELSPAIDAGYVDEELEILSIKYAKWLARSPEERLAFKLGSYVLQTAVDNYKIQTGLMPPKRTRPAVSEQMKRKASGL
jgi:hypothetical protein